MSQTNLEHTSFAPTPRERFVVVPATNDPKVDAFCVQDSDHDRFNLPENAVHLRLRRMAATRVAVILNEEWRHFVFNPE